MENEVSQDNKEDLININANYFKLDFPEQKIEKSPLFEKFKKQKLKELGKDSKLFHCKIDNIYFYVSKIDCKEEYFYYMKCPLCNKYSCYFCQRTTSGGIIDNCCIKSKLYYLFCYKGFEYFNGIKHLSKTENQDFYIALAIFCIPFIFLFALFVEATNTLAFELVLKNKKWRHEVRYFYDKYSDYYSRYYHSYEYIIKLLILKSICYSICYTIYAIYFNIFILFISLFSNFYPLKYCVGIIVNGSFL